jgi:hypothetical protein
MPEPKHSGHPLVHAVFQSIYRSRAQRGLRFAAVALLFVRHGLRGFLFSWPLYVLAVAGLYSSGWLRLFCWSLAVPGIALSLHVLLRGLREEYAARVVGRLLARADLGRLWRGGAP